MDLNKDYYLILGVSTLATSQEIKTAFRKLAATCHPDHHPENKELEERFKDLSEAYTILSSTKKRSTYNRRRHEHLRKKNLTANFSKPYNYQNNEKNNTYIKVKPLKIKPEKKQATQEQKIKFQQTTFKNKKNVFKKMQWWKKIQTSFANFAENMGFLKKIENDLGHIYFRLTLNSNEALYGTEVKFEYMLDEKSRQLLIKIPAKVKNDTILKLSQQGYTREDGGKGDLILTLHVLP